MESVFSLSTGPEKSVNKILLLKGEKSHTHLWSNAPFVFYKYSTSIVSQVVHEIFIKPILDVKHCERYCSEANL